MNPKNVPFRIHALIVGKHVVTLSVAESGGVVLEFVYEWEKSGSRLYSRHLGSTVQTLKLRRVSATFPHAGKGGLKQKKRKKEGMGIPNSEIFKFRLHGVW